MSPGGLLLAVNDEDVMNKLAFAWFICLKNKEKQRRLYCLVVALHRVFIGIK